MKIKLTVKTRDEFVDGKRVVKFEDKEFELDLSLGCQMRWEQKFPQLAANEDLLSYTERVSKAKELTLPVIISKIKAIYCYFDTELTFVQFLKLFDLTNKDYIEKLTNQIKEIFESVYETASEKN